MSIADKLREVEKSIYIDIDYHMYEPWPVYPALVALVEAVENDPIKARSVKHALQELKTALDEPYADIPGAGQRGRG